MSPHAKHTPGKWILMNPLQDSEYDYIISTERRRSICAAPICAINTIFTGDFRVEQEANSHLILSAPALFEALKAHVEYEQAVQAFTAYVVASVVDGSGSPSEHDRLKSLKISRFARFIELRDAALSSAQPEAPTE